MLSVRQKHLLGEGEIQERQCGLLIYGLQRVGKAQLGREQRAIDCLKIEIGKGPQQSPGIVQIRSQPNCCHILSMSPNSQVQRTKSKIHSLVGDLRTGDRRQVHHHSLSSIQSLILWIDSVNGYKRRSSRNPLIS